MTTTLTSDEREERLRHIRANRQVWYGGMGQVTQDIDFLLSLIDSQAATKPVGWISCGLRHGHDRIVDIVFENADCAKAFIDSIEPTVGPIVAATRMREKCVEKVRDYRLKCEQAGVELSDKEDESSQRMYWRADGAADALEIVECELESLTLDNLEVAVLRASVDGESEASNDTLEALEMRHEYDTGTHSIYRYRGGTGQIDVQICVPYGCLKTEFDVRLVLTKPANASTQS